MVARSDRRDDTLPTSVPRPKYSIVPEQGEGGGGARRKELSENGSVHSSQPTKDEGQ